MKIFNMEYKRNLFLVLLIVSCLTGFTQYLPKGATIFFYATINLIEMQCNGKRLITALK